MSIASTASADRRYFIAVTSADYPDTWSRCRELAQWGSTSAGSMSKKVHPGDRVLIWLGRTGFKAIAEFTTAVYQVDATEQGGRLYPFR